MTLINFLRPADDSGDIILKGEEMQGEKIRKWLPADRVYAAFHFLQKEDTCIPANNQFLFSQDTNFASASKKKRRRHNNRYYPSFILMALMTAGYIPVGILKCYISFTIHTLPEKDDRDNVPELVVATKNSLKRLRLCSKLYTHAA